MTVCTSDEEAGQRQLLRGLFDAALGAARIEGKLAGFLPPPPIGRTVVIGGGKAAAAMAAELDRVWSAPLKGAVVTSRGSAIPGYSGRIEVLEASHPVPDESSVAAGEHMRALVRGLGEDDLVLALISGGASSLMVGLPDGVSLADKQAVTRALLASGAPIREINMVRQQLSTVKGGGLAQLAGPARIVTLAVSDIPGDAIGSIGSGPTIVNAGKRVDALEILARYGIMSAPAIERHLASAGKAVPRAVAADRLQDSAFVVVRPADSLAAAASVAIVSGYLPMILGDDLEGEARDLGAAHARLALQLQRKGKPVCLISGGETTVTVRGKGRGGRNGEYVLGALLELGGQPGIAVVAADTDGIDGSEANAGAMGFPSSMARAAALRLDAAHSLAENDSYGFCASLGDLLLTGPTYTNVNDFRAILIEPLQA